MRRRGGGRSALAMLAVLATLATGCGAGSERTGGVASAGGGELREAATVGEPSPPQDTSGEQPSPPGTSVTQRSASEPATTLATSGGVPQRGGIVTVALGADLDRWDGQSYVAAAWSLQRLTARCLLEPSRAAGTDPSELVPAVAADLPRVSGDGRRWEFRIRRGLRFSDGAELTPADVKASFERALDPASGGTAARLSGYYTVIEGAAEFAEEGAGGIRGIRVAGDRVTFELTRPEALFAQLVSLPPVCIAPASAARRPTGDDPALGVGPYRIAEIKRGRGATLERNPHWEHNVARGLDDERGLWLLDGLELFTGLAADTQELRLRAGQLELSLDGSAPAGAALAAYAREHPDRVRVPPAASVTMLALRAEDGPLSDVRLRRAVALSIDREAWVAVAGGPPMLDVWSDPIPPALDGRADAGLPHDAVEAARLVRQAGADGTTLLYGYPPEVAGAADLLPLLREQLGRVGLRVEGRAIPGAVFVDELYAAERKVDLYYVGFQPDVADASAALALVIPGPADAGRGGDAALSAAAEHARTLTAGPERGAAWRRVADDVARRAVSAIVLDARPQVVAMGERLRGADWSLELGVRLEHAALVDGS